MLSYDLLARHARDTLILVLSENSSFKESQIVTITSIGPNHVIPCGNICPPNPLIIIVFALR